MEREFEILWSKESKVQFDEILQYLKNKMDGKGNQKVCLSAKKF